MKLSGHDLERMRDQALQGVLPERDVLQLFQHIQRQAHVIAAMNGITTHQTDRIRFDASNPPHDAAPHIPHRVHPLTCGNDSNHTPLFPFYNVKEDRLELHCRDCDYTQPNGAIYGT